MHLFEFVPGSQESRRKVTATQSSLRRAVIVGAIPSHLMLSLKKVYHLSFLRGSGGVVGWSEPEKDVAGWVDFGGLCVDASRLEVLTLLKQGVSFLLQFQRLQITQHTMSKTT